MKLSGQRANHCSGVKDAMLWRLVVYLVMAMRPDLSLHGAIQLVAQDPHGARAEVRDALALLGAQG